MTAPLVIAIPLASGDLALARDLLTHLAHLGPVPGHTVLFVADHGLSQERIDPLLALAKPTFPSGGSLVHCALSVAPAYPHAHNHRFETAARHIEANIKAPFLWLDPRCVPTRKSWLVELESEYRSHAHLKPVLGALLTPATHGTAANLVSSTAIYPPTLPKRIYQRLIAQRGTDWEKSCADLLVPLAHPSQLIFIHAVNGSDALPKPPSIASLVHTAQARAFAAAVRGEVVKPEPPKAVVAVVPPAAQAPVTKPPPAVVPAVPAATPTATARAAYYHSGDLGDIIYALAAIRLAGGGGLLLGPRSRRTPPPANPMREDQFERFAPLLSAQPYLNRVSFIDRHPGSDTAFDLNIFRDRWGDKGIRSRTGIHTLAAMHCYVLGVADRFNPADPWLCVPQPIASGLYTVHRSNRYRADDAHAFPWERVVKRFRGKLLFVGLASEHAEFQRDFGVRTAFWLCQDFLELARVIAGSLGFIGNQSFPNSLALGCGQRVLQEAWQVSPDCRLPRANYLSQPFTDEQLEAWVRSPRLTFTVTAKKKVEAPIEAKPEPVAAVIAQPRRAVSTTPINGLIELGPQRDAHGLGDTLCITPLAERLGERAVMVLPEAMRPYACLFEGLCPVRVVPDSADYPEFPPPRNTSERFIEMKLRQFGFECEDGRVAPVVKLRDDERLPALTNTVVLSTACSPKWAHIRTRPLEWWQPVVDEVTKRFQPATLFPDEPLRTSAARLASIGLYLGTNSGPWHLAMAVGCRCLVIDADECDGYAPSLWRYDLPDRCEYVGFDATNVIAKLPWLLGEAAVSPAPAPVRSPKRRAHRRTRTLIVA